MLIFLRVHAAYFPEHTSEDPRDAPRQKHFQAVIKNTVEAEWPDADIKFCVDDEDYDPVDISVVSKETERVVVADIENKIRAFESAAVISAALAFP